MPQIKEARANYATNQKINVHLGSQKSVSPQVIQNEYENNLHTLLNTTIKQVKMEARQNLENWKRPNVFLKQNSKIIIKPIKVTRTVKNSPRKAEEDHYKNHVHLGHDQSNSSFSSKANDFAYFNKTEDRRVSLRQPTTLEFKNELKLDTISLQHQITPLDVSFSARVSPDYKYFREEQMHKNRLFFKDRKYKVPKTGVLSENNAKSARLPSDFAVRHGPSYSTLMPLQQTGTFGKRDTFYKNGGSYKTAFNK